MSRWPSTWRASGCKPSLVLKRLALGLVKGLLIGGGIGAALHFGVGWTAATGLLAYLLAMGVGATTGVLTGKPPWRQNAWIESVLKGVAGVGVGALLYWLASNWGQFELPLAIPGVAEGASWTEVPMLTAAGIGGVFGTLVELDNTDDAKDKPQRGEKRKVKARVAKEEDLGDPEVAELLAAADREREL